MEDRGVRIRLEVDPHLVQASRQTGEFARQLGTAAQASDRLNTSLDAAIKQAYRRNLEVRTQGELERQRRLSEREQEPGGAETAMQAARLFMGGGAILGGAIGLAKTAAHIGGIVNSPFLTDTERGQKFETSLPVYGAVRNALKEMRGNVTGINAQFEREQFAIEQSRITASMEAEFEGRRRNEYLSAFRGQARGEAFGTVLSSYAPRGLSTANTPAAEMANLEARTMNPAELARAHAQAELAGARRTQTELTEQERQARRDVGYAKDKIHGSLDLSTMEGRNEYERRARAAGVANDDISRRRQLAEQQQAAALEELQKRQVQLQDVLNQKKLAAVELAQREGDARKAELGVMQAQTQVLQAKAAKVGGIERSTGAMTESGRIQSMAILGKLKQFGPSGLTPEEKSIGAALAPEYFGRAVEKLGAGHELTRMRRELEGVAGPETGQQLRAQALQVENRFNVQVVIDEKKLAQETGQVMNELARQLIKEFRVQMEVEKRRARQDALQGRAQQAGSGS